MSFADATAVIYGRAPCGPMRSITRACSSAASPYSGAGIEAGQGLLPLPPQTLPGAGRSAFRRARFAVPCSTPFNTLAGCGGPLRYILNPTAKRGCFWRDTKVSSILGRSRLCRTGRRLPPLLIEVRRCLGFAAGRRHPSNEGFHRPQGDPAIRMAFAKRRMESLALNYTLWHHGAAQRRGLSINRGLLSA